MLFDRPALLAICDQHRLLDDAVVVPEPYIPHGPSDPDAWNGILVLAEAQNLTGPRSAQYRQMLEEATRSGDRMVLYDRLNNGLYERGGLTGIGVGPWDGGTMKLVLATLQDADDPRHVAVSNAVVWSALAGGATERITSTMQEASVLFWRDMLKVLNPNEVWAFGATARTVMRGAGVPVSRLVELPGPFMRRLDMGFSFDPDRLLVAYPEVRKALDDLEDRGETIVDRSLAIHCACAAVERVATRRMEAEPAERTDVSRANDYRLLWREVASAFNHTGARSENKDFRAPEDGYAGYYMQIQLRHPHVHYEWALRRRVGYLDVALHFEFRNQEIGRDWLRKLAPYESRICSGIEFSYVCADQGNLSTEAKFRIPIGTPSKEDLVANAARTMKTLIERTWPIIAPDL